MINSCMKIDRNNCGPTVCYLCGKTLGGQTSRDHVPPQQFFADEVRRAHKLNLLRIPTHYSCNYDYHVDEDYFVNILLPFAMGSYAGDKLYSEILRKYKKGKNVRLIRQVLSEFDHHPSGLFLPGNKVVKRLNGPRIHRVAWKIVRGLHFHHFTEVLPENLPSGSRRHLGDVDTRRANRWGQATELIFGDEEFKYEQ
jgi:hypothetical protein